MPGWVPSLAGRRGPLAAAIVDALADDVAAGALRAGDRLPPQRELAAALGVSANTVLRAYAEAGRRGYVEGHVGRGTYVRAGDAVARVLPATLARPDDDAPVDLSLGLPFAGGSQAALAATLAELARSDRLADCLDRADPAVGAARLRTAAAWMGGLGAPVVPDRLVVTNGAQHGVFATLLALLAPGDTLLTEPLTYAPVLAAARHLGVRVRAVAADAEGVLPDALAAACREGPGAVLYCTPTLATPTTATAGEDRRRALAAVAARHALVVVEDDVFGFLPEHRPAPIAAFAPRSTVLVTSVSKSMAPGLRVGFVHAPEHLVAAVRRAAAVSTWMPAPLTVEIVHRWLRDGTADRLARAQRRHAAHRQAMAARALAGHDLRADAHGLHVWLPLPPPWTGAAFALAAERAGVLVNPAETFATAAPAPAAVRLCLSHEGSDERVARGLATVDRLLAAPGAGDLVI